MTRFTFGRASSCLALFACSAEPELPGAVPTASGSELGRASAALSAEAAPATLAFSLDLDGARYRLALERSPTAVSPGYQSFRRLRDGSLVSSSASRSSCSYRGEAETLPAVSASSPARDAFASVGVCPDETGQPPGQALSGVIRAGGRYWKIWPDANDTVPSDGVDHWALPVQRGDSTGAALETARSITVHRAPESPAPRLEFREGTTEETKYIELVLVSDAARVAGLGGQAEATGIRFIETMNALLEGSGLVPRLRVTLRAQVLFDADPYVPAFAGNEVDHESLIEGFLTWARDEELPEHDEHLLLSGLNFLGGTVGYAGLEAACTSGRNGFIVQAGEAGGGFAALSAVHELGHTVGMSHDDGDECPERGFIMAAVGCANCPSDNQFSSCSREQFRQYLAGPAYAEGARCADDVPSGGGVAVCGDALVEAGESCDCGGSDCGDVDPCCNGATCQLEPGAECSDFNDGCCQSCTIVGADAELVCRAQRSDCDTEEVCTGLTKECPSDSFEIAGRECEDERGNPGACFLGDCPSRATQCEQIAEQEGEAFADVGEPGPNCEAECNRVVCGNGPNACVIITGPTVPSGVPCSQGQCVDGACVALVDQCPNDPTKSEPGTCGCGSPDSDSDADGAADCVEACPGDKQKQAPGDCGCGTPDTDSDGDATPDCIDRCPSDASKETPGACGCGNSDGDTDGDGTPDCNDECPDDPANTVEGACGCGVPATDTDGDGAPDCNDACPNDALQTLAPCEPTEPEAVGSFRASTRGSCAASAEGPTSFRAVWLMLAALPLIRRRRQQ